MVLLLPFSSCTLRFSTTSGLNLPPALNFDKSFFNLSKEDAMSASRPEKSNGSSDAASPESDFEAAAACFSSRAAFPPFFERHCDDEKLRVGSVRCTVAFEILLEALRGADGVWHWLLSRDQLMQVLLAFETYRNLARGDKVPRRALIPTVTASNTETARWLIFTNM